MNTTIGTCSSCGGPVQIPAYWGGIMPPTPQCAKCGATPKEPFGRIIPMKPARKETWPAKKGSRYEE